MTEHFIYRVDGDTFVEDYETYIKEHFFKKRKEGSTINQILEDITNHIDIHSYSVNDKVLISKTILNQLSKEERKQLAIDLINEQVIKQRTKLDYWSTITAQSSQIDTGYIAQHLVSLQTQIPGQGMRGKGDDLSDGSEVKSANFLSSQDKKGASAPRWNFTAVTRRIMERFLDYSSLYLLSIDKDSAKNIRIRIWKVNVLEHDILRNRYKEWMDKKGYPKFNTTDEDLSVNFQLFPPHSGTDETFARHGNGMKNGFDQLEIPLENHKGSELIFRATCCGSNVIIDKF